MMEIKQRKKNVATLIFWILLALFVLLNLFDSANVWDGLLGRFGWWKNIYGSIRVGVGWRNACIVLTFPGIVFTAFPVLAIVFSRKRVVPIVLSAINILLGLFATIAMFRWWWPYGICWLVYTAAGVLLLLNALGIGREKQLAGLFFALGIISIAVFDLVYCVPSLFYVPFWFFIGELYPLSQAMLYFVFSVGILCDWKKSAPACQKASLARDTKQYNTQEPHWLYEQDIGYAEVACRKGRGPPFGNTSV